METAQQISKKSKSSFYYTFAFLPKQKRNAIKSIYAFCRMTDDIVDNSKESKEQKIANLKIWKNDFEKSLNGKSENPLLIELYNVIKFYKIPTQPFFDLIDGVEMDLEKNRFENFEELKKYCYNVASTVGLMTIPIFGYKNSTTEKFAVNLGIALQLTNIIRDVNVDVKNDRIYLPKEDLEKFNYSEFDLMNSVYNENFCDLMKFEAERAREFYRDGDKYLSKEDKSNMFTARAMEYIYLRLLDKIEIENFNVFSKKISVSNFNKIFIALFVFIKYKTFCKWLKL
ncbi:MAG: presqualene diphosphate synthase HpnD [Ignavibacteriae bacterium]|nr:presqualene diphosphate synthase HpnD [Ignavibacteriota bacterium]